MLPLFSTFHQRKLLALVAALALTACASRKPPATYPASSPASADAAAPALPNVTRALDGDPPLDSKPGDGWIGLGPQVGEPPHHPHHQHQHQGHAPKAAEESHAH